MADDAAAAAADPARGRPDPVNERLASLLRSAADGDMDAFEAFYNATVRGLVPAVRRICGDSHVDDVLSDTYFQAWRSLHTFDTLRGEPNSWLRMIATSRARDRMRVERVRHGGLPGALEHDADLHADPRPGPEEIAQARQQCERLHGAIRTLPPRERQVLGLYITDRSHDEICASTGMPLGTVKTVIMRSKSRLRGIMAVDAEYAASSP